MTVDSHVHIGGKVSGLEMTECDVLYAMNTYKIDKILVSNADSVECDANQKILPENLQISQYDSNVRAINFARNNVGHVYVGAWIKPNTEHLDRQFEELIERNLDVVKAIKVHPFYSALKFNDEKLVEYIEFAESLNLPIVVHTATDDFSKVDLVFEMAKRFPNVKFLMAHLELGSDNQHAIYLCSSQSNLYGDTAWVSMQNAISFTKRCSSEKLLFGSDTPIDGKDTYATNKEGQRSIYQDYFFELSKYIAKSDYEKIMSQNAIRFFGM